MQHFVFTFLPIVVEFSAIVIVLVHFEHAAYPFIFSFSAATYAAAFTHRAIGITKPSKELSEAARSASRAMKFCGIR